MESNTIEVINNLIGECFEILGMRIDTFIGEVIENTQFGLVCMPKELIKPVICCKCNGDFYEISFWNMPDDMQNAKSVMCNMEIKKVDFIKDIAFVPVKNLNFRFTRTITEDDFNEHFGIECFENKAIIKNSINSNISNKTEDYIFIYETWGGGEDCSYGKYNINEKLFSKS